MNQTKCKQSARIHSAAFLILLLCASVVVAQQSSPSLTPSTAAAQKAGSVPAPASAPTEQSSSGQSATPARSDFFRKFAFSFEIGGQPRSLSGEKPSKFEEYKRVRDGFLFRRFRIESNPEGSPYFFRLVGRGPSELDQSYILDTGMYGRYRATLEWSGLPHLYARGTKSFFGSGGPGVYVVPDSIQSRLQNAPDASLPGEVQALLATQPFVTLQVQRETLKYDQRFNITDKWSVRFRLLDEKRYGDRPHGIGAYERVGTSLGDTFRVLSIELPRPVDYRTDQIVFGSSYITSRWGLNFDYTYSRFRNREYSLVFDNPFRITDMQATSNGNFNRLRFARGSETFEPDNHSNSFLFSGYIQLPHDTRLASALGWSRWRQDEAFVPFTTNTAVTASNLPPGVTPTQLEALPERSLDGKVNTFTQDHLLSSKLTKKLAFNAHYRYYDYDNDSRQIEFPGYAAVGESFWRTNIAGLPIENEPVSYLRRKLGAEAAWEITKQVTWKWEYEWENLSRVHRQVAHSDEHTIGTQLSLRPFKRFDSKLLYKYSDRTPEKYDPGVKEFSLLRLYDQAKRVRHDLNYQWELHIKPQLGVSGTFGYLSDDYDQNFFGLTRYTMGSGSVDMLYMPKENTTIYANYSRELIRSNLQSVAKTAAPFDLRNRWDRLTRDLVDSFGIGVTSFAINDKLFLDCHYNFSLGSERITTANPSAPLPNAVLNATAFPWPEVRTRFHELNTDVSYQIKPNVALGFRYTYQPYRLSDFAWDGLSPYPIDRLAPENDGRRFLLLDSRYTSHDAHVVGIYIRFSW